MTTDQLGHIPDSVFLAIGRVTAACELCAHSIQEWTWLLAEIEPDIGLIMTHRLSFANQALILESLVKHRAPSTVRSDEVLQLIATAKRAEQDRNSAIHSIYGAGASGVVAIKANKGGTGWNQTPTSAEKLNQVAASFLRVSTELAHFKMQAATETQADARFSLVIYLRNAPAAT